MYKLYKLNKYVGSLQIKLLMYMVTQYCSCVAPMAWYCYWIEFEAKTWKVILDYFVGVLFGTMLFGWLRIVEVEGTPQKN